MPMMFFYFLKIIFDTSTSKRSKKYKPHSILAKKTILNLVKNRFNRRAKLNMPRANWSAPYPNSYLVKKD